MTMPTSIFKYLPSVTPSSVASSVIARLPGLPGAVTASISQGVSGLVNQFGQGLSASLNNGRSSDAGAGTPLTSFLTDIQTHGVSWNNRFYARLAPPEGITRLMSEFSGRTLPSERLMMRCEAAELPGTTFAASEIRFGGAPSFRAPVQPAYSDLTLTFLCSTDMVEKYFFDYWHYLIKDSADLYGYYDDIVANDLEVCLFTPFGDAVYGARFHEAWPISLNPISLSWQDQDIMRLSVMFAYARWAPVAYDPPIYSRNAQGGELSAGLESSLGFLRGFSSLLPAGTPGASALNAGLRYASMTPADMIRTGTSLVGSSINTRDPISRAIIGAAPTAINSILNRGKG